MNDGQAESNLPASGTPETETSRSAKLAEMDARWEKVKKNRERRQKISKALVEEEKKTGLPVPFTLKMRYGLIHVVPENDGDLEKYAEREQETSGDGVLRRGSWRIWRSL